MTADIEHLGRVAYETWQRQRGVPGDARWDLMPAEAREGWRVTAQAVVEAASPIIRADERQRIIEATSSPQERLGLFKLAAADGALRERERIARLAEERHATWCPGGVPDAPQHRGHLPFADLIRSREA